MLFTPHGCWVCGPVTQFFWVSPSLQNPEKTADKFSGSLIFWVDPSLQNLKKTAEKSEFQKKLDKPVLQNPEKPRRKPHFKIFWGPLKIAKNHGKIQILKPVHREKTANIFFTGLSFKILRHCGKIHVLRIFWVP